MDYKNFKFQISNFQLGKKNLRSAICNLQLPRGFTLIELLVSMAILMLLMTVSAVNFGKADQNEFLRFGVRRLADSLQTAQSFAQSGTIAQYPTARSYGVHTDAVSQKIILFADQNTASGIGRWDGDAQDADGKKDALVRELGYDSRGKDDVKLTKIVVITSGAGGDVVQEFSSLDIAAIPSNARLVFSGVPSAGGILSEITGVKSATFTVTQVKTGKTSTVVVNPLSGRIDVDY